MKLLLTILLTLSLSAHAEFVDGNKLYSWLNGDESDRAVALGYVSGVFDVSHGHCAPPSVTMGQVEDMTRIALSADPATRHNSASLLVFMMLEKYWPCPKKAKTL